jgi:hypothetical protein
MENVDISYFSNPVIIIVFASVMLLLSIITNGLLLKFSLNLGTKNEQEQVRWAPTTKPALGGISFYILFLFSKDLGYSRTRKVSKHDNILLPRITRHSIGL